MKITACFAIMAFSVLAFTSCNKEKECNCTMTTTATGMEPQVIKSTSKIKDGKCSDANSTSTSTVGGVVATVTLVCE